MRRAAVAAFAALVGIMPASARDLDAEFLIKREGKVIGHHKVDVATDETGATVTTEIRMKVKFGPIPLYKYRHDSTERWENGALVSVEAETNDNGDRHWMTARRTEEDLMIEGSAFEGPAPAGAAPSSYWNKSILDANALISTQSGEIIDVTVKEIGDSPTPQDRPAEHYQINGTVALNLWYDGARWIGAHFVIDGEELTYEPVEQPVEYAQASGLFE